ncbi:dipeptidase [Tenacibaculum sp. UWU-22]|uniref:dipeptidase n=1 Tax=Tenacibaculum sp. UWU-22 TaxID=3234187 RepID=UPI0034DB1058
MKKIIKVLLILLGCYFLLTLIVPTVIDKIKNTTTLLPPYKISSEAKKLYDSLNFKADMHCDALLWNRNLLTKNTYGHVDIPRLLEAHVALQAFTIVTKSPKGQNFDKNDGNSDQITSLVIAQGNPVKTWFNLTERALQQCKNLYKFAKKSNGKFRVITSKNQLEKYILDKKNNTEITAGFIGVEGAHALSKKLENVDVLYNAGVRMMAPTHFFDNALGGSAHGVSGEGLTDFGKKVIAKMQEKNMLVDVAHASPKMIDDILAMTKKPIIDSHTGVKGTCDNVRNLSDKHIKGIAKTGGLICIAMFKKATCDTTVKSTAKAIKYVIDLVGADFVALGSDFDGAVEASIDVTGLPLIVEELLKLGVSKNDIQKIMGGNVKRLLLKSLPTN